MTYTYTQGPRPGDPRLRGDSLSEAVGLVCIPSECIFSLLPFFLKPGVPTARGPRVFGKFCVCVRSCVRPCVRESDFRNGAVAAMGWPH